MGFLFNFLQKKTVELAKGKIDHSVPGIASSLLPVILQTTLGLISQPLISLSYEFGCCCIYFPFIYCYCSPLLFKISLLFVLFLFDNFFLLNLIHSTAVITACSVAVSLSHQYSMHLFSFFCLANSV